LSRASQPRKGLTGRRSFVDETFVETLKKVTKEFVLIHSSKLTKSKQASKQASNQPTNQTTNQTTNKISPIIECDL
jgi:hypothetical protein